MNAIGAGSADRTVPPRALAISVAALAVPIIAAFLFPESLGDYDALLWLLALVPAFLLSYYRGWRGATLALTVGMAALAATQAAASAFGRELPPWPILLTVTTAFIAITLGIGWLAKRLEADRLRAERLALTDPLTGLPNRRHAELFLEREFAAARRGRPVAVVLFDMDRFKEYNDRHGHPAGDAALRIVGRILRAQTREMDLPARYGGEEFLVVLSETGAGGALALYERVRDALQAIDTLREPLTLSAGVAAYDVGLDSPALLIEAADDALYRAKRDGRDRVGVYRWTIPV